MVWKEKSIREKVKTVYIPEYINTGTGIDIAIFVSS